MVETFTFLHYSSIFLYYALVFCLFVFFVILRVNGVLQYLPFTLPPHIFMCTFPPHIRRVEEVVGIKIDLIWLPIYHSESKISKLLIQARIKNSMPSSRADLTSPLC